MKGLEYSKEALQNRPEFYSGLNQVNIFVEDADSQYLYEEIFNRLLGEKVNNKTIFPCGGKTGVVEMFKEHGSVTDGIKNVYIVDGDFDWFLDPEARIDDPQFVYLKRYNIESYLLNETGACQLIQSHLKCIAAEAYERLKFLEWYYRIIDEAKELFLCYVFVQKEKLSISNVGNSPYIFIDSGTGFKRTDGRAEKYKDDLLAAYPEANDGIEEIRAEFERRFGKHYEILICGKFLMTSLRAYIHNIVSRSISFEEFIWTMVKTFDVEQLDYVREVCLA